MAVNPTTGVQLPALRGKRERIASPTEASQLLAALPQRDRAVWATALYAGLRSGELQALTDELVDLDSNVIRVHWSWDPVAGRVAPKSRSGRRTVPVPAALRKHLLEHRLARGRRGGLFFGRPNGHTFSNQSLSQRAARTWRAAGLEPIGLHECRHTFASLMIAAGVNAKALSTFLGHASVTITLDRYGHLFPGSRRGRGPPRQLPRTVRRRGSHVRVRCTCAALRCTNRPFSGVERGRLRSTNAAEARQKVPANRPQKVSVQSPPGGLLQTSAGTGSPRVLAVSTWLR